VYQFTVRMIRVLGPLGAEPQMCIRACDIRHPQHRECCETQRKCDGAYGGRRHTKFAVDRWDWGERNKWVGPGSLVWV
jgi:hypothetical protein